MIERIDLLYYYWIYGIYIQSIDTRYIIDSKIPVDTGRLYESPRITKLLNNTIFEELLNSNILLTVSTVFSLKLQLIQQENTLVNL